MKRKLFEYFLVLLLLSPLLFINIRDSHDWGDDFAGYLIQARNISEGKPFYQSKFEFHNYNPSYAPPYYTYGFPLLLSPIVKAWGLNYKVLDRYMSLWLIAWALLVFSYLRRYFSLFACLSFTLIFFLNPFFFDFKTYVIADVPFSFFFLLSVLLYIDRRCKPLYYQILTGLAIGFANGIRGIGVLILATILANAGFAFIRYLSGKISKDDLKTESAASLTVLFSFLAFTLVFNYLLFPAPHDQTSHFLSLFLSGQYWDVILKNLDVYTDNFNAIFHPDAGKYTFAPQYTAAFMLVLLVIGFIRSFPPITFEVFLSIMFGVVVLLFPFSTQGFRYLLPILPVLIYCIIEGAKSVYIGHRYYTTLLAVLFVVFTLLQYRKEIREMHQNQNNVVWPGAQTWESMNTWDYIRKNIPDTALIASLKPRAVELMTGYRTCVLPYGDSIADVAAKINTAKPGYLLSIKVLGPKVDSVAVLRKDSLIWENMGNRIYICKDHQNR